jgi:hypothetical protein
LTQPLLQPRGVVPGGLQRSNSATQRPKSTGKRTAVSPAIDIRRGATLASAALTQVGGWCALAGWQRLAGQGVAASLLGCCWDAAEVSGLQQAEQQTLRCQACNRQSSRHFQSKCVITACCAQCRRLTHVCLSFQPLCPDLRHPPFSPRLHCMQHPPAPNSPQQQPGRKTSLSLSANQQQQQPRRQQRQQHKQQRQQMAAAAAAVASRAPGWRLVCPPEASPMRRGVGVWTLKHTAGEGWSGLQHRRAVCVAL